MFRSLLLNTAISAVAYFIVSVVGPLLLPVLIASYGLAGFGLIVMARLFMPLTALAVLDFGYGEISTQAVARARSHDDWPRCAGVLTLAIAAATGVGLTAGVGLIAASPDVPGWMGVPAPEQAAFGKVVFVTGLMLPLLFASLVFEGVVKGFERYAAQRSTEVIAAVAYAIPAAVLAWSGQSFDTVCYALLAALGLRAVVAGGLAFSLLRSRRCGPSRWHAADRVLVLGQARVLAANKMLGAAQTQLAPLLIGIFLSPLALGTYDALVRLPRFAKVITGLLSSAVLPVAARLESAADNEGLRRLGQTGLLVVALSALPPVFAAAAFSEPILRLWLGPQLAIHWPWHAAMFMVPALGALIGLGSTALIVRPQAVSTMNRLIAMQIVCQLVLSLIAMQALGERAFILGQVLAVLLTFFAQMRLIGRQLGISALAYGKLLRLTAVLVALALPAMVYASGIVEWRVLLAALPAWLLVAWASGLLVVLRAGQWTKLIGVLGVVPSSRRELKVAIPFSMSDIPSSAVPVPRTVAFAARLRSVLVDLAHKGLRRRKRTSKQVESDYDQGEWKATFDARHWERAPDLETYVFSAQDQLIAAQIESRLCRVPQRDYYRYRTGRINSLLTEFDLGMSRLVEIGCGAGRNLFCAALANRWTEIRGLDLSPVGLEIVRRVARRFDLAMVSAGPLDLLNRHSPGFAELHGAVAFTYHCLEQLPNDTEVVLRNLTSAGVRRVIHIEPTRELFSLASFQDWASISYIWRQNYLADLVDTTRRLESEGLIRIVCVRRLGFAPTLRNTATLVVWEPVQPLPGEKQASEARCDS